MVARIPNRRCHACHKFAPCYEAGGGWNCGDCAPARVVAGKLATALDVLARMARDCPEAAASLAGALRNAGADAVWGGALHAMAERAEEWAAGRGGGTSEYSAVGIGGGPVAGARSGVLDGARRAKISCDFPDLATAYEMGQKHGPKLDEICRRRRDAFKRLCIKRGFVPPGTVKPESPNESRWAVNYLRHERTDYTAVYGRLQRKARARLKATASRDEVRVVFEMIHRIVKNRVQDKIAGEFPELAGVAMEQRV